MDDMMKTVDEYLENNEKILKECTVKVLCRI